MKKILTFLLLFLLQISVHANPIFKNLHSHFISENNIVMMIDEADVPSQSNKTKNKMDTTIKNVQSKKSTDVYLDKTDSIFIAIKARAATDLKESSKRSAPNSPENKLNQSKVKAWPQEKQDQLQDLFVKSINDYTIETNSHYETENTEMFIMNWGELDAIDLKQIAEEYEIRVQSLGDNKYAAEFWEDHFTESLNIEAAVIKSNIDPEQKSQRIAALTRGRKLMKDGTSERYTKNMSLLYTKEKDGSILFHEPFQQMIDFINK